jgi:hypothetical protein
MAGVVTAEGVGDADHRARQRLVRIPHPLDESAPQIAREAGVAIACQPLVHAAARVGHLFRSLISSRPPNVQPIASMQDTLQPKLSYCLQFPGWRAGNLRGGQSMA